MDKKEKQIQIPYSLLARLFRYFLIEPTVDDQEAIKKALEGKLDALARHELYSRSKTAETEEEREKARQEYLDRVGIHESFRW